MTRDEYKSLLVVLREESSEVMRVDDARALAASLRRYAAQLDAINLRQCNGHQTSDGRWDSAAAERDEQREEKIMARVRALGDAWGLSFHFNGDRRGFAIKLHTPKSERYNTWGGREEGWGIGR